MSSSALRPGRPRRYDIQPTPGFASPAAGYAFAALRELSDRLFDLISDLPQAALDYVPEGTTNSVAMLAIHMIWAEAGWVSRITRTALPADLAQSLQPGRQDASGELPPSSSSTAHLMALCDRVRSEVTEPALAALDDVDTEIADEGRPMTARGVLMHVVWHWTYHSGQVGLLRRLWGAGYRWTFDQRIGAPGQDG